MTEKYNVGVAIQSVNTIAMCMSHDFKKDFEKELLTFSAKADLVFFRNAAKENIRQASARIVKLKRNLTVAHIPLSSATAQRELAKMSRFVRNLHFALDNLVLKKEA